MNRPVLQRGYIGDRDNEKCLFINNLKGNIEAKSYKKLIIKMNGINILKTDK